MRITGRAWTFGSNINTDLIFPKTFFKAVYAPGEMSGHLMAGLDAGFAARVQPGDIIVGGPNFGCGSSREEAAGAMREAGIGAVVAPGFGRLFTRNSINLGLPVITATEIDKQVSDGDTLTIDLTEGVLLNESTGFQMRIPPMAEDSLRLMQEGGIAAYTRKVLDERKARGEPSRRGASA